MKVILENDGSPELVVVGGSLQVMQVLQVLLVATELVRCDVVKEKLNGPTLVQGIADAAIAHRFKNGA